MDFKRPPTLSIEAPLGDRMAHRRGPCNKLYTLWMVLMLVAVVGTGFGLSYLAYDHIIANAPAVSVETIGDLGEGGLP
jgi:hypothetical protein